MHTGEERSEAWQHGTEKKAWRWKGVRRGGRLHRRMRHSGAYPQGRRWGSDSGRGTCGFGPGGERQLTALSGVPFYY
jgi:hypothetical protein